MILTLRSSAEQSLEGLATAETDASRLPRIKSGVAPQHEGTKALDIYSYIGLFVPVLFFQG